MAVGVAINQILNDGEWAWWWLAGALVLAGVAALVTHKTTTIRDIPPTAASQLKLVDVSLSAPDPTKDEKDDLPVLDVMVRNIGGQPAVPKRMIVHVRQAVRFGNTSMPEPYDGGDFLVGAGLDASATYDVSLPDPEAAAGAQITVNLSQVVGPQEADRFLVRLARPYVHDIVAYLLHLDVLYNEDDRKMTSPSIAVVFPQRVLVASAEEIRKRISRFQQTINEIRMAIDREMVTRGLPAPDWRTAPPRNRDELPTGLVSVDGNGILFDSGENGVYIVNENFWNPERTIHSYLEGIEKRYQKVVEIGMSDGVVHELLRDALPCIQATLEQLPELRGDLPSASSNPDFTDELVRLLGGQRELEELRARANAGERKAASRLHTATRLTHRIQELGRDHPESLDAREAPILWRIEDKDMAGAAAALADLVADRKQVQGHDHPRTLSARHYLAKCRGEAGHVTTAVAEFTELVSDQRRVQGHHSPSTLASRHELARWRAMTGDAAGAARAFADLVADREQVDGPDHWRTLKARYNLAECRAMTGEVVRAVEAFRELLSDYLRALGLDHPDTVECQRALVYWRGQASPESEA